MTFVVALREARWKRLQPWWSPQQRGRRSSFVGLSNLGINPCVPRACWCCDCLRLLVCVCLFLSQTFILGFGLDLRFGGITALREWPNIFTKPLGSGVVRLFICKVKFGTAFVVHVGVGTSDSLCRNFWRRREFQPKVSGLVTLIDKFKLRICS